MADKKPVKLVLRKSSLLTKAAILAVVVLSTVALVNLKGSLEQAESQFEALRHQAAILEAQNQQLSERIENLGSVESAIRIAMEELGLIPPDSTVLDPGN